MLSEDGFMRNTSRRTVHAKPVRAWSGRWRRDGIDWHRPGGAFHAKRYVRRFGATARLPKAAAIRVDVDMFGSASPDAALVDASGSTLHVKLWMRRAAHHARNTSSSSGPVEQLAGVAAVEVATPDAAHLHRYSCFP